MIDWQAVRDEYVRRFGSIPHLEEVTPDRLEASSRDPEVPPRSVGFWLLTFFRAEAPAAPVTYASFGAMCGGAGSEIFLTAVAPSVGFHFVVQDLACSMPRDPAPLTVVHHAVRLTSFDAMLVVPEEDGSFAIGAVDGRVRHALRLVPITPAERRLAASDPQRLLTLLRAQGALVADPLRACVVAPEADGARRANVARLLEEQQRTTTQCAGRHRRLLELGAPEEIVENEVRLLQQKQAMLAHLEARVPAVLAAAGGPRLSADALEERLGDLYGQILEVTIGPYRGLVPEPVGKAFAELILLLLATHPLVHAIAYEAAAGAGQREATSDPDGLLTVEIFTESAAARLSKSVAPALARAIERSAEAASDEARRRFEAGSTGVDFVVESWAAIVPKLCLLAADLDATHAPPTDLALQNAARLASAVDLEPSLDTGPARARLARIGSAISKGLFRDYLGAVRNAAAAGARG